MLRKWWKAAGGTVIAISLAGCTWLSGGGKVSEQEKKDAIRALSRQDEGQLKVLAASGSKDLFMRDYGGILMAKFPELDLQVVVPPPPKPGQPYDPEQRKKDIAKLIEEEKPDLLAGFGTQDIQDFVKDGRLLDLEPLIKQTKFDLENLHPGVTDTIRMAGNGKLYGLSPTFSSSALIYNTDLFDQYQIPYPKDGMNWEDVIKLATRFPTHGNGDIYGYYYGSSYPYLMINSIARQAGLSETDAAGNRVIVDSEPWKRIWHLVLDAKESIYFAPQYQPGPGSTLQDSLKRDKFMTGQAAMTIASVSTLDQFDNYRNNGFKSFNWDLVTEPIDPQHPGESTSFFVTDIFAVGANSQNQQAAWSVIQFVTSEAFAKVYAKSGTFRFSARISANKPRDGHNLDAFFKLKPSKIDFAALNKNRPNTFSSKYIGLAQEAAIAVQNGKSVDEALAELQAKAQAELEQAKQDEAAKKTQGGVQQ